MNTSETDRVVPRCQGTGAKVVDDVLSVISLTPRPLYLPELLEYYDPFSHGGNPLPALLALGWH